VTRALLVCPGRGSYAERALGSLPVGHPFVERADALRAGYGLPSLAELDRAARFDPKLHLRPANVSLLIWLVNLIDAEAAAAEHEITCVAGNSMGWYTALAVTGALSFEHGFRLVQDMALLQEEHQAEHGGGQMIQPWVDDDWRPDAARRAAIEDALASSDGEALLSIDLGGYAVLAGSEAGLKHLARTLPKVALGQTTYPFRLMQHGAYHTPLVAGVAERAAQRLADLEFRRPRTTLIDGTGRRHTPWSADTAELARYTLGEQVVTPYDLTLSLRVALREHAPERTVCPGPGNTLGGVVGQTLIREGWHGIRSRADFERAQAGDEPVLVSMRR
jgi:malonyl CoA-acyl carrier protein transacylase